VHVSFVSTGLAPRHHVWVLMRLSRIGQRVKDEPCAKRRALLGVSSSLHSSVSRGIRSIVPMFS
jgi:hypothetical protein